MKWLSFALMIFLLLAGCSRSPVTPSTAGAGSSAEQITLTSSAFGAGQAIPKVYTCQGEDRSPAVAWSKPPQGTKSLALIVDDPDAPGKTWVHWVVYDLPANIDGLAENASVAKGAANLPQGAQHGKNSWGREDYGGPCPPSGTHHYRFHVYALDILVSDQGLDQAGLVKAMDGHILSQGELVGTYAK
jgi:Raf kinase inhibitor-like YbhB/YbcL family protein